MSQYDGSFITLDEKRSVFVGNDGESFALRFTNKENVGNEELIFGLSAEAAEFVALSMLEQLYMMFPDKE